MECTGIEEKCGLTLVIEQVQVSSHDSHKRSFYQEGDGFKHIEDSMRTHSLVNPSSEFLGKPSFFFYAQLFISVAACTGVSILCSFLFYL